MPPAPPRKASVFSALLSRLLADAGARGLRKANGVVYGPLPGMPCTFAPVAGSYEEHVSRVFGAGDEGYVAHPDANGALCRYIAKNRHLPLFPELSRDPGLLSFANGVLELADVRFTPHGDIHKEHPLFGRAARHHVAGDWTGREETPALDAVLDRQGFEAETKTVVLALMGRALFPANAHDRWGVLPVFAGHAEDARSGTAARYPWRIAGEKKS